ncbi:hypothetical protein Bca52824_090390 [Brassica carinata]|uniref:Uncharacterized protein n=1 Tax=Brassica carinata TaxID=52824 RepID=A0A8X7NZG3_BRACI|nr:hypothetical protein Bca52824_090390 [Brassica carinata]
MGLVRRIFSGKVVFRSSGSVSGKKKLLQFFFAGFCFSERCCDSIDVDLIPLVPSGEGGYVGCGSSISGGFDGSIGDLELVSM